MSQIDEIKDPAKVKQLADCYVKIDYYYDMIEIAEQKRDMLIKEMTLEDIRAAIQRSSRR